MSKKEVCIVVVIFVSCTVLVCHKILSNLRPHKASDKLYTIWKIQRLHSWCLEYETNHGEFPHETDWPRDLVGQSLGEYDSLDSDDRKLLKPFFDAWKKPFQYRFPGRHNIDLFEIYSVGPNGVDEGGGGDDLGDWEQPSHNRGFVFKEMTMDWHEGRAKNKSVDD